MSLLQDLVFSDLFVASSFEESWYKETPDSRVVKAVPEEFRSDLEVLLSDVNREMVNRSVMRHVLGGGAERPVRARKLKVAKGETIYVCRGYGVAANSLHELGMHPAIYKRLLAPDVKEGLVAFIGKPGGGKTTAATTFIREKLSMDGGVAFTVEYPIELDIQGRHGKGVCYQTEVDDDNDIEAVVREKFQASPNILFIGEVYGAAALREAIKAAAAGVLVVITFHSKHDLQGGLAKLHRLGGSGDDVGLADVLTAAIHVDLKGSNAEDKTRLVGGLATGTPPRFLAVSPLFFTKEFALSGEAGVRNVIRDGNFHQLSSEITRQKNILMSGGVNRSA